MLHLCPAPGIHLPNGRQPRPDMALTPTLHLVRGRTQRRHRLLLRADIAMSNSALLAQVAQLSHLQLQFWPTLRSRRLRWHCSQLELQHVQVFLLQTRE